MLTLLNLDYTTEQLILLIIFIYATSLAITHLLILILNTLDSTYGTTKIHYYLPIISIICYFILIIYELTYPSISERLNRISKYFDNFFNTL